MRNIFDQDFKKHLDHDELTFCSDDLRQLAMSMW